MKDGLFYLYGNLACNAVVTLSALWLLTDRRFHRVVRASLALIAAGAVVNVTGMSASLLGVRHIDYGHVWPGELVGNFGTAVLLGYWVWRNGRHKTDPAKSPIPDTPDASYPRATTRGGEERCVSPLQR